VDALEPARYIVKTGTVQKTLTLNGRITPVASQPVFFEVDGIVTDVRFASGDEVSAGDVIASLSTQDLQYQLDRARLNLKASQLKTNLAEVTQAQIAVSQAVTEDERRLAEAQLADAQNQAKIHDIEVQLLQEDVNHLEAEIAGRQITAPFDGVIQSLTVHPGDSIVAFAPIGLLVDPSRLEVTANVTPEVVLQLGVGQAVTVTLPVHQVVFHSAIQSVPTQIGATEGNVIRISLPEDFSATSGELATIFIVLQERRNVLTLPPAAIRTFQGRAFVIVAEPDGSRRRYDVQLGLQSDTRVEIVNGVTEGQIILGE
jgi:macrolide-specific efflux system membrane fusion protein